MKIAAIGPGALPATRTQSNGLAAFFLLMGLPHIYSALRISADRGPIAVLKRRVERCAQISLLAAGIIGIVEIFSL